MKVIHTMRTAEAFVKGKWTYKTVEREVRVMAEAEGYAMVRIKGGVPFVARKKELRTVSEEGNVRA